MKLDDLKEFASWVAIWWFVASAVFAGIAMTPINYDDSDPGKWGRRSGMVPRTDSLTGCQYLQTSGGGITPRLGAGGEHVGCRKQ